MDIPSYLLGKKAGGSGGAAIEVVTELPTTGESNVIYLVPKQTAGQDDVFDEYIWVNNDWELIGSTAIDISGKQDIMQFSTMPTADSTTVGKIIQYVGTTTNDYTNGYFYIGTTDGAATPTYGWENINVQPGSSSSGNVPTYVIVSNQSNLSMTSSSEIVLDNDTKEQIRAIFQDIYNKGYNEYKILFNYKNKHFLLFSSTNVSGLTNKPDVIFFSNSFNYSGEIYFSKLSAVFTWTGDILTVSSAYYSAPSLSYILTDKQYLKKTNTAAYTVSGDYNPATKKYVDDSIAAAITTTLGGSF